MSSPRDPAPDLSLERLGDRAGSRRAPVSETAQVRLLEESTSQVTRFSVAYQALIDAAFTAPGAAEWLSGLGRWVAALVAGKDAARTQTKGGDAIRAADPEAGRF
jgi:hypothetical protein